MNKKKITLVVASVLVLLAIIGGIFAWRSAQQKRTYEQALASYDNEDFQTAANLFESLGNYEDSETRYQSCQYELTVDRRFLRAMAQGLVARWESDLDTSDPVAMQKTVETELSGLKEFKNITFEDSQLQQYAVDYITALEDSIDALTFAQSDYLTYDTLWNQCYLQRSKVIVALYNNYALPIDSSYADVIREFDNAVKSAEKQQAELDTLKDILKNNMTLELDGPMVYDGYLATGTAELYINNTSAYDLDDMYVEFTYYTANGKKTTAYTNVIVSAYAGQSIREPVNLFVSDNYDPDGYWEINYPSIQCRFNDNSYEKLFTE